MFKQVVLLFLSCLVSTAWAQNTDSGPAITVWDLYGKRDAISHQNFSLIHFDQVSNETIPIPQNVIRAVESVRMNDYDEYAINKWIKARLYFDYITTYKRIHELSIKEVLGQSILLAENSMRYQKIDSNDTLYNQRIRFDDCLFGGKGDCSDYALSVFKIFNWFKTLDENGKSKNENVKNVFVIPVTADPFFENHAWNIILIFTPEELIYSHFDITPPDGEVGKFKEGSSGKHYSENEDYNLAVLYEVVKEYTTSYAYYKKFFDEEHLDDQPESLMKNKKLEKMALITFLSGKYEESYSRYIDLYKKNKNPKFFEKMARSAYRQKKYDVSLDHYEQLFEESELSPPMEQLYYIQMISQIVLESGEHKEDLDLALMGAIDRKLDFKTYAPLPELLRKIFPKKSDKLKYGILK